MDELDFDDELGFDDEWDWDSDEDDDLVYEWAEELAGRFFLSDNDYLPNASDDYDLGFLEAEDWEPLVNQLDELVDLDAILNLADQIQTMLPRPGLPTELLEAPLDWLESALEGELPPEPSGRKVNARRLIKIALAVIHLAQELPDTAQAAIHAWAEVHRGMLYNSFSDDELDFKDLLEIEDLPPAVTGFSMVTAMSMIHWPERAEVGSLPPRRLRPIVYAELMSRWEALPDSPVEEEDQTESLFAQAQLAHLLAQMDKAGSIDEEEKDSDAVLTYSRLSRAILWVHNQCRHCPERDQVTCKVAVNGPEHPVPLLDTASEIAQTGQIEGCIRM
ncbi:MAG: hypothetical protein JXM73_04490 [Anaerolineae bacterium]|nr:hypothetical protein [Anaerolineae bacterium]